MNTVNYYLDAVYNNYKFFEKKIKNNGLAYINRYIKLLYKQNPNALKENWQKYADILAISEKAGFSITYENLIIMYYTAPNIQDKLIVAVKLIGVVRLEYKSLDIRVTMSIVKRIISDVINNYSETTLSLYPYSPDLISEFGYALYFILKYGQPLSKEEWLKCYLLFKIAPKGRDIYNKQLVFLLLAAAPTSSDFEQLLKDYKDLISCALTNYRTILSDDSKKKFDSLETDDKKINLIITSIHNEWASVIATNKIEANQRSSDFLWDKLRQIFVGQDKHNKPTSGRMLREEFWTEGYNKGAVLGDEQSYIHWLANSSHMPYKDWYKNYYANLSGTDTPMLLHSPIVIPYLTTDEKEQFKITSRPDGLIFDSYGRVIDTTTQQSTKNSTVGYADCVLTLSDTLYIFHNNPVKLEISTQRKFHAYLSDGRPVYYAGGLKIENGKITTITLHSGHYKPEERHLIAFLNILNTEYNVSLDGIKITTWDLNIISDNAKSYSYSRRILQSR